MIFDELQAAFIEQERLQLNVDSILLVRGQASGNPLASKIVEILKSCARPGFSVENSFEGLPDGWVLIAGVQLFGAPPISTYNELVPLARDQLTITRRIAYPVKGTQMVHPGCAKSAPQ